MANSSDDFNRDISGGLNGSTSSSGHTWTRQTGFSGSIVSAASNTRITGSAGVDYAAHYLNCDPASADYKAGLDLTGTASGARTLSVAIRMSKSANTSDRVFWRDSESHWEFREYIAGTESTLASDATNSPVTNAGTLEIVASGTGMTATYKGSTLFGGSVTVGVSAAGVAGVFSGDDLNCTADNFYQTDTAAAGRTTKNSRSWNLGRSIGMGLRMPI